MSDIEIGPNLFTLGNNGTFEDAIETWGNLSNISGGGSHRALARSDKYSYEGNYSCKATTLYHDSVYPPYMLQRIIMSSPIPLEYDKKYIFKAKVRCDLDDVYGNSGVKFTCEYNMNGAYMTTHGRIDRRVDELLSEWKEINVIFSHSKLSEIPLEVTLGINSLFTDVFINGTVFFDKLELYELGTPVPGCMDPNAENYDPNANVDDGSCTYAPVNTGYKAWATLEEYHIASGLPTGQTKPNAESDPDYVPPVHDPITCPLP